MLLLRFLVDIVKYTDEHSLKECPIIVFTCKRRQLWFFDFVLKIWLDKPLKSALPVLREGSFGALQELGNSLHSSRFFLKILIFTWARWLYLKDHQRGQVSWPSFHRWLLRFLRALFIQFGIAFFTLIFWAVLIAGIDGLSVFNRHINLLWCLCHLWCSSR